MKAEYYEYDPADPDSWVTKEPPSRPDWFDRELVSLAGVNRHGQPNLRLVWGGTQLSDKTEDTKRLKYHAGYSSKEVKGWRHKQGDEWIFTEDIDDLDPSIMVFPDTHQEQLGVPRWVIEKWISPEELEQQRRHRNRKEFHDTEYLLREFPREGVYDCYFVVQNSQGKFRQIDRDVLHFIKIKWSYENNPEEAAKLLEAFERAEEESEAKQLAEIWSAGYDIRLDKEERERQEEYWAKHHDYVAEYQRMLAQA